MSDEKFSLSNQVKIYLSVFIALCVFTVVTFAIAPDGPLALQVDYDEETKELAYGYAIAIGLLVAIVKGTLVSLYFMHLNHETKFIYFSLGLTVIFFFVCLFLPLIADSGSTRSAETFFEVPQPDPWVYQPPGEEGEGDGHVAKPSTKTKKPEPEKPKEPDLSGVQVGPVAGAADTATLAGVVKLGAAAPFMPELSAQMAADPACAAAHAGKPAPKAEVVVAGAGGELANVFIYVSKGIKKRFPPAKDVVKLDQKGCLYSPHVFGVRVGQTVEISNSDPTLHNVHTLPKKSKEMNQGQGAGTPVLTTKFGKAEVMVKIKCDVHSWMNAYVGVVEHPYFGVSKPDGTFQINETIAPGTYIVTAWHEKY
ncbi:MAG: cytochrome C oxidase subunit IV family protein, partial [Planctomycetota bacterium]